MGLRDGDIIANINDPDQTDLDPQCLLTPVCSKLSFWAEKKLKKNVTSFHLRIVILELMLSKSQLIA